MPSRRLYSDKDLRRDPPNPKSACLDAIANARNSVVSAHTQAEFQLAVKDALDALLTLHGFEWADEEATEEARNAE